MLKLNSKVLNLLIVPFCLIMMVTSCNDDKGNNIPSVTVSDVESTTIDFRPYTLAFDSLRPAFQKHPIISEIFFGHVLGLDIQDSISLTDGYKAYLDIEATQNIARLIDSVYSDDVDQIASDWNETMAYYHHYFPDAQIPWLYIMQTNLGIANFLFENAKSQDAVGVSLDFFLGKAFPYIQLARENPAFSAYNNRTFNRDHIITKSVNALVDDLVGAPMEGNMLNSMIREGKRLYILDAVCATTPDTAVFEYTTQQMEWVQNNELEMWNFFVEQELIYEQDIQTFGKYIRPGPTSQGMPEASPSRTANYIGYKIVSAFMDRSPNLSFSDMLAVPSQKLYMDAKYKPGR